jgi:hypothetical protein
MARAVVDGDIAYPKQVVDELSRWKPPDAAHKWAKQNHPKLVFPEPTQDCLDRVLQAAPDVVDVNKRYEDADPYVLAMALCVSDQGREVVVVTEDVNDYPGADPPRISVATACGRLGLTWEGINDCLHAVGII